MKWLPLLLVVSLASGCSASHNAIRAPFVAELGTEAGPESGDWGDGTSGPVGMHVGCIRGRELAVAISVRNRTNRTVTLMDATSAQPNADVIDRAAVQLRLAAPPPSNGDRMGESGLRAWSARPSGAVVVPPKRSAWIQSNFLMRRCTLLRNGQRLRVSPQLVLAYEIGNARGSERVSVPGATLILTRGPLHPALPLNRSG